MKEKEFKKIDLSLNADLVDAARQVVQAINSRFDPTDLYLEKNGNYLYIYLRELDLRLYEEVAWRFRESDFSRAEKRVFDSIQARIDSIKSYGIKNGRRIYVDYNKERKVKNRVHKEEKRGKYFYAEPNNFSSRNNQLPDEFVNKIFCADSGEFLKQFPDNCIDLVFTSPPYNFGLDYSQQADDHYWKKYFDKLFRIFEEVIRVVKFGGRIIINIQPLFSDYIPSHHLISNFFLQKKLIWKGEILWEKNNYNCKYTAWGSWKSPSNPYLKYTWEFLEIFCKGDLKKPGKKDDIDITADEFKKWVTAKWAIAPENRMKEFNHPAVFPEELVRRVLKLFSYRNDIVLDPFNGVGTTTSVAHMLGRRYVGIDIASEYCKIACDRI